MSTKNPFIAGNWVRADNFFGREQLIREILESGRNYVWVAGTRRFGKTSLLKQIEYLTNKGSLSKRYISLFWDLQGSQDLNGLTESLIESVEDAEDRFADIGIEIDEIEELDVFAILRLLRRKAKDENIQLLLLCDEAEELINIEKHNPEALPKLRRIFQRGENISVVLTATKRLSKLETSAVPQTSPFLHGFVPPVYLTPLENEQAQKLIQLGGFDPETTDEIQQKSNNHPYLIQLLCKRLFETQNLQQVLEEVAADDMIGHFFSVDFHYLEPEEKEILLHIHQNENLQMVDLQQHFDVSNETLITLLYELNQLGFISQSNSHYHISNFFFRKWLEREKEKLFTQSSLRRAETTQKIYPKSKSYSGKIPEIGDKLGENELLEKLGSGGMGIVFKGHDQQLDRLVALKVLLPELMDDDEFKERFLLEARAASSLNHANIATIYQIGESDGIHFISMEFVEGDVLKEWQKKQQPKLDAMIRVAVQACRALAHAHQKKVVHRDVKSENIMVTAEGEVKIMDFGLAKTMAKADDHLTKTGTTVGTLAYMSPEQASGLETDNRTDIFSMGVVLYELFTGQLPFTGDFELSVLYAIMNEDPKPLQEHRPDLPEDLQAIVDKALQKDKNKRYQSMSNLADALEDIKL